MARCLYKEETMKFTQKKIVLNVVEARHPESVPSYDLQKRQTPWGWLGTSADRTARRLAEEGKLVRTLVKQPSGNSLVHYSLPTEELAIPKYSDEGKNAHTSLTEGLNSGKLVQTSFSSELGSTMR